MRWKQKGSMWRCLDVPVFPFNANVQPPEKNGSRPVFKKELNEADRKCTGNVGDVTAPCRGCKNIHKYWPISGPFSVSSLTDPIKSCDPKRNVVFLFQHISEWCFLDVDFERLSLIPFSVIPTSPRCLLSPPEPLAETEGWPRGLAVGAEWDLGTWHSIIHSETSVPLNASLSLS